MQTQLGGLNFICLNLTCALIRNSYRTLMIFIAHFFSFDKILLQKFLKWESPWGCSEVIIFFFIKFYFKIFSSGSLDQFFFSNCLELFFQYVLNLKKNWSVHT